MGVLALRVALAAILIVHGWGKLKNLKGTWEWFGSVGFKPGKLWGTLATFLEFFGGIALLFGFLTQLVALFVGLQFIVIIIWKLARKTPFSGANGWELDLLILGAAIALFHLGAGAYALDKLLYATTIL